MTPTKQTLGAVALLSEAFPRLDLKEGSIIVYAKALSRVPDDLLAAALERYVATGVHFPAIAEILRAAAEIDLALPTPEEALGLIGRAVKHAQSGHRYLDRSDLPPTVAWAAEAAGVTEQLDHGNPGVWRAQFFKAYEGAREAALRNWALNAEG